MYICNQGRLQDFAQGGDKTGARRPKFILSPLYSSGGGDRIRSGGTKKILVALRPFCPPPEQNPVSAPVYKYIYMNLIKSEVFINIPHAGEEIEIQSKFKPFVSIHLTSHR